MTMADNACWTCGEYGHHRRDCQLDPNSEEAKWIKRESRQQHRIAKPSSAGKEELRRREILRNEKPVPKDIIRKEIERMLQLLVDTDHGVYNIGLPDVQSESNLLNQRSELEKLDLNLEKDFKAMGDIITRGYTYFNSLGDLANEEDHIFRDRIEALKDERVPTRIMLKKRIADVKEAQRLLSELKTKKLGLKINLDECDKVIRKGKSTRRELDAATTTLQDSRLLLSDLQKLVNLLQRVSTTPAVAKWQEIVNTISKNISHMLKYRQQLMDKEMEKLEKELAELKIKNECKICMENEKEFVYVCGHQVCRRCIRTLKFCPFCGKLVNQTETRRLLYN